MEKADKAAVKAAIQKMSKQVEEQDAAAPAAASAQQDRSGRPSPSATTRRMWLS